ncbi:hypothetical protein [Brachyspira sp.]|uniref:hypothetical protein n=1 Tax=Brachyspira sp. TaxID=1977261 RepID=UPI002621B734|nr:hypothetical protein [Brachyspira sp.]
MMKDIEDILGEEKIILDIHDDDPIIRYINSFDNVLYSDYFYSTDSDSCIGLFAYIKDDKYLFGEFGFFKENREELKFVVSDYPVHATVTNYELTNDKFNDILNLHNIFMEQFFYLLGKNKLSDIKAMSLKKISLDEYIEIFPHRYINNRIKMNKKKYHQIYFDGIYEYLSYRCSYCGSTDFYRIINNDINNLKKIDIDELYDNNIQDGLYICGACNLISRSPNNIMDYI